MKYDLNILNEYLEKGLLVKQVHPTQPLSIWNYSRECQYSGAWDDVTINCRGLVLDNDGNVIAKTFPKFFNYEEHKPEDIPNESFEVYEKMDGSLGIFFYYKYELSDERRYNIWFNNNYETGMERFFDPNNLPNFDDPYFEQTPKIMGEWIMATRGSFTSEQSIKGKEMTDKLPTYNLNKNVTYLFEILFKSNRIVVDYGEYEGLVLLGAFNTKSGDEISMNELKRLEGFEIVTTYKTWGEGWNILKQEISKDNEGYVVRFKSGFRMKIKGTEYVRLHKILTNFTSKNIWEMLMNNEPLEPFLESVPDEFDKWVKEKISNFKYSYYSIDEYCGKMHDGFRYGKYGDVEPEPTKKEFAKYIEQFKPEFRPIMFSMWDKKPYDKMIWKLLKPEHEKPFRNEN